MEMQFGTVYLKDITEECMKYDQRVALKTKGKTLLYLKKLTIPYESYDLMTALEDHQASFILISIHSFSFNTCLGNPAKSWLDWLLYWLNPY